MSEKGRQRFSCLAIRPPESGLYLGGGVVKQPVLGWRHKITRAVGDFTIPPLSPDEVKIAAVIFSDPLKSLRVKDRQDLAPEIDKPVSS